MQQIKLLDPEILQGRDVLKAHEIEEFRKAENIVAEANDWAADRVSTLKDEIEEERREAFANAYSDGLSEFIDAVEQLDIERKALEDRVADMVTAGLKRVLSELPAQDVLLDLMRPAFSRIQSEQDILVMGHPDDLQALTSAISHLQGDLPEGLSASAVADGDIEPGNCMIYTEDEVFKVGVSVAVEHIKASMASDPLVEEVTHAERK